MSNFVDSINEILDRRQADIAISKRSILFGKTQTQRKYLFAACVLLIYSSLEGGVKELTGTLLSFINRTSVKVLELKGPYLKLAIERQCQFSSSVQDIERQLSLSAEIRDCLLANAELPGSIDTESNITPKVIRKICRLLDIDYFLTVTYEKDLNQLLRFRNSIAHGDQNIPIDMNRIDQFSRISQHILCEFAIAIADIYQEKSWLRTESA